MCLEDKESEKRMLVKIKKGTYGYNNGITIVPINSESEPIELEQSKAEKLIKEGVAVEVTPSAVIGEVVPVQPELEDMEYNDLKKLAKELGVKASGSKSELCEAIRTKQDEEDVASDDVPDLKAELPQ